MHVLGGVDMDFEGKKKNEGAEKKQKKEKTASNTW